MWRGYGRQRWVARRDYATFLVVVRRQRVQIFKRMGTPSMTKVLFCTLALNVRLVRGALRSQRPECLCLILRP